MEILFLIAVSLIVILNWVIFKCFLLAYLTLNTLYILIAVLNVLAILLAIIFRKRLKHFLGTPILVLVSIRSVIDTLVSVHYRTNLTLVTIPWILFWVILVLIVIYYKKLKDLR